MVSWDLMLNLWYVSHLLLKLINEIKILFLYLFYILFEIWWTENHSRQNLDGKSELAREVVKDRGVDLYCLTCDR